MDIAIQHPWFKRALGPFYPSRLFDQFFGEGLFEYDLLPFLSSTISPYYRQSLFRTVLDSGISEVRPGQGAGFSGLSEEKQSFPRAGLEPRQLRAPCLRSSAWVEPLSRCHPWWLTVTCSAEPPGPLRRGLEREPEPAHCLFLLGPSTWCKPREQPHEEALVHVWALWSRLSTPFLPAGSLSGWAVPPEERFSSRSGCSRRG